MVRRELWIATIVSVFITTSTLGLPQILGSINIRGHHSSLSPQKTNIFQRSLDTGKDSFYQGHKILPTPVIITKNSMSRPIRRMGTERQGKRENLIVSDEIKKENGSRNNFTENMSFRGKQKENIEIKSLIRRKRNIQPYHNKKNIFRILLSNNYGGDLFGKRFSYVLPKFRFHDDAVGSEFLGKRGITGSEFLGKRAITGSEFLGKRGITGSEFLGKRGITGSEFLGKRGITGSEFLGKRGITGSEFLGKSGITGSEFLGKRGLTGFEFLSRKYMEPVTNYIENEMRPNLDSKQYEYWMAPKINNDRQNSNVYYSAKPEDPDGVIEMQTKFKSLPINEKLPSEIPTKNMNVEPILLLSKRGMGSEFLGKRGMGSEFLGKRRVGAEFLGKRRVGAEFLGKRRVGAEFLGKRRVGAEFLGKRRVGAEFLGKRRVGAEFLGKRKIGSNFINDRLMESEFSVNGKRRYGSKLSNNKGLGYEFLGKRSNVSNDKRGMGSEFLGKRALEVF